MVILGIDPGLTKTGFGVISVKNNNIKLLDYGIIEPNKTDSLSKRLFTIHQDIENLIDTYLPTIFSIEEVFYGKNIKSALLLGQARGSAMITAAKFNIPVFEYSAKKVKQAITGNGNADKIQVQYMIKQMLKMKILPQPLDASDAIAIALCHLNQMKINEL